MSARAELPAERWSFTDWIDALVAVSVVLGGVFIGGYLLGRSHVPEKVVMTRVEPVPAVQVADCTTDWGRREILRRCGVQWRMGAVR